MPKPDAMKNDRLVRMMRGASRVEKFIVGAIVRGLTAEQVDDLMTSFDDAPMDQLETVAGQPFVNWYGKNLADLKRQGLTDEQIDQVRAANKSRGMEFDENADEPTTVHENDTVARRIPAPVPQPDPATMTTTPPAGGDAAGGAATAGIGVEKTGTTGGGDDDAEPFFAGRALSEYDAKSDAQILEMPNVGATTLEKIRTAQTDRGVEFKRE